MKSRSSRLDRFIARQESISLREVQSLIAQCRVHLDGKPATSISQTVGQFSHVTLDQRVLQGNRAHYVMLHKPEGVVSTTTDSTITPSSICCLRHMHARCTLQDG